MFTVEYLASHWSDRAIFGICLLLALGSHFRLHWTTSRNWFRPYLRGCVAFFDFSSNHRQPGFRNQLVSANAVRQNISPRVWGLLPLAQGSLLEASLGTWDQAKPDPRCPCQARGYLKTGPTLEYPEHIFFYQLNDIKKNKEKQHDIVWYIILCQ